MSAFEKHPKTTLAFLLLAAGFLLLVGLEWSAKHFMGLGDPVVYQSHPIFGYRPIPNQHMARQQGKILHFNNLGLRADTDWDAMPQGKMLFLGDSVTYGGSYIANDELFSHWVQKAFPQVQVGNAGVNAWGVENVCALVQNHRFLPAEVYISTFPEGDFARGLNRFGGQPFWPRKPRYALEELYYYYLYKLSNKKYDHATLPLSEQDEQAVMEQAVTRLKTLDHFLRARGFKHLIFITPSKAQALKQEPRSAVLQAALAAAGLQPIYLLDTIQETSPATIESWYYDTIHLTQAGHQQWAQWMIPPITTLWSVNHVENQYSHRTL